MMYEPSLAEIPESAPSSKVPPPVDRNPQTEALFAAELSRLSMKERDEVLQDIHGVADSPTEDLEFVQKCFGQIEEALLLIPIIEKTSYLRAIELDESYVTNEDFLLMFLRACSFDVNAAAARMVAFFETKNDLFGPEKLAKEITYEDLDEDDIRCLESGYAQILSGRDRAGRAILFLNPMIRKYRTLQNRLRAAYMVLMHCLRDEETQKNGMVGVAYNVGSSFTSDREAVWRMAKLVGDLPTKFRGIHYCYDNEKVKMLFSIAMFVWEKSARIRCRIHCGTDMECIYNLMTFGIPAENLPINAAGDRRPEAHQDFCKKLKKFPTLQDGVKRIVIPSTYDVLLGRGKPLQKHPGNLRYHHIVDGYQGEYEKMQKLAKTNLSKMFVQQFKDSGHRFMKQDEGGWIEVDDEAARYKVSHTFRNHRIAARVQDKKKTEGTNNHRRKNGNTSDTEDSLASVGSVAASEVDTQKRRRLSDASSIASATVGI